MATFSKTFSNIVDVVLTECTLRPVGGGRPFYTDKTMWDTGSENTLVSSRIIKEMGLQPIGQVGVSGIGGNTVSNAYYIHLDLNSGDVIAYLEVLESDFDDYDVIIGMDVIGYGDFHLDNSSGHSVFSFRIP